MHDIYEDNRNIDLGIKYSFDENIYVIKRSRMSLKRAFFRKKHLIPSIIEEHKTKSNQIISKSKCFLSLFIYSVEE